MQDVGLGRRWSCCAVLPPTIWYTAAPIVPSTTGRVLARSVCVSIVRFGSSSAGVSPIIVVAASWRLMSTSADAPYTDPCEIVARSVTSGMRTIGASASHLRLQSASR